jgi:hypothetical protein
MLTGYNTDIRHGEVVLHVQTEDKGRENPAIETVIYLKGQVLATRRTAYAKLIEEGKGEREVASLMEQQHRTLLAAIRGGRFDQKIGEALGQHGTRTDPASDGRSPGRGAGPATPPPAPLPEGAARSGPPSLPPAVPPRDPLPVTTLKAAALAEEQGPTLDQVILEYLETEAEQDHLVLVLDGPEELRPGRLNQLTLRAFSSKSGEPLAGVQIAVRMLSTLSDPRTLFAAETGAEGSIALEIEIPPVSGGSAALIISGSSELGRAEIKQLL